MQNQKWAFCVSALGGWAFRWVPDRWRHWNHSHRSKTHHLPNRNVLAVIRPHKQAFEGGWAGRRTDGRHSRVNTHTWGPNRVGSSPNWERPEWVTGSQWEGGWGDWGRVSLKEQMHHQLFHKGWEKPGKKAGGRGGGLKPLKQNADSNNSIHTGNHWLNNKPQCWLQ